MPREAASWTLRTAIPRPSPGRRRHGAGRLAPSRTLSPRSLRGRTSRVWATPRGRLPTIFPEVYTREPEFELLAALQHPYAGGYLGIRAGRRLSHFRRQEHLRRQASDAGRVSPACAVPGRIPRHDQFAARGQGYRGRKPRDTEEFSARGPQGRTGRSGGLLLD